MLEQVLHARGQVGRFVTDSRKEMPRGDDAESGKRDEGERQDDCVPFQDRADGQFPRGGRSGCDRFGLNWARRAFLAAHSIPRSRATRTNVLTSRSTCFSVWAAVQEIRSRFWAAAGRSTGLM